MIETLRCCYNGYNLAGVVFSSRFCIYAVALWAVVCIVFIFVVLLDIDLSPGGRCIMAAAAAFEIKVEKISRMGRVVVCWESTSMFAGRRSNVVLHAGGVSTVLTQRHRRGATL